MSSSGSTTSLTPLAGPAGRAGREALARLRSRLARIDGVGEADADLLDQIEELERLKCAAAAAQARLTTRFADSQRRQALEKLAPDASAGERRRTKAQAGRSTSAQIALARHESPARGQMLLGLARALADEMPHTAHALAKGDINEWRATIIARETSCLTAADRRRTDAELAPRLAGLGDKRLADTARGIAQRLDAGAAVRRARRAETERRVSLRPAPDTMTYLTALLPVAQGVAVYAALRSEADALHGQGDPRTPAQLMADTLVTKTTGLPTVTTAEGDTAVATPGIEIQLVMSQRTLIRGDHEPARIPGFGPIPAPIARRLARRADKVWLRRLFTHPATGELVATDSRRRLFDGRLRELVITRDQTCRNPWCDAPIRHVDHIRPRSRGGTTAFENGQGLCEACNYVKEAPGWRTDVIHLPEAGHVVEATTPTNRRYHSQAPPQPGAGPPGSLTVALDRLIADSA